MTCPICGHSSTTVVESQQNGTGVRRSRRCEHCSALFSTYEQPEAMRVMVRKRDGRREHFRRDKLLTSLRLSARKRDLTATAIEAVVEDIERRIAASDSTEVPSRVIGEMAIAHLRTLDPIAYIRFASAYRQFVSLDDMFDELERLEYSAMPPAAQPPLFDEQLPQAPRHIASAPSLRCTRQPASPMHALARRSHAENALRAAPRRVSGEACAGFA